MFLVYWPSGWEAAFLSMGLCCLMGAGTALGLCPQRQALMWLFLCHWYGSRNMVGQCLVDPFWAILSKPQVDLERVCDITGNVS